MNRSSRSQDLFDGICSAICCTITLTGLIYTLITTDFARPLAYIPAFIFWGGFFIFSIFFTIKVYLNTRKVKQGYRLRYS